jgi:hypothetical protein
MNVNKVVFLFYSPENERSENARNLVCGLPGALGDFNENLINFSAFLSVAAAGKSFHPKLNFQN